MNRRVPRGADGATVTCREVPSQRAFDVCVALFALGVLAPFMLLIAVVVWLESGRPIYFSQLRLGKGGRPFYLYKFRKFRADCGSKGLPLTLRNDVRMTAVGRFLALTKVDELPQLWNVLRGDMSIVGPRPESLAFADCFSNGLERVLDCRPGLFGPSQVLFRHEDLFFPPNLEPEEFYRRVLFPAKARIDLEYFSRRSPIKDLGWIIRGAGAVIGLTPSMLVESHFGRVIVKETLDGADS
jgi:lipopolysaccharide/colanic/teichoic acid biosynthesis glycosyltransferase